MPTRGSKKRKFFVIDTSVLLYHGESVHSFPKTHLVIPMEVLEELDKFKDRNDNVGNACRYVSRFLDKLREKGNLMDGVTIENGQTISVSTKSDLGLLPDGMENIKDNLILSVAYGLKLEGKDVTFLTRDINLRIKANALGLKAEGYSKEKVVKEEFKPFSGMLEIDISQRELDDFYKQGFLQIRDLDVVPNQCVVMKTEAAGALGIVKEFGSVQRLRYTQDGKFNVEGIRPRSKEQRFAMELLLDPSVHLVTLSGPAGCGKTLLAASTSLHQLFKKHYDKIIISRPVQSTSKDIGFLPGSKSEKMMPWLGSFTDNLKMIIGDSYYLDTMMERGQIEVESLSFIRGRSLPRTIFILDEAQNITHEEAKAVLTRMGEDSKLILLGDLEQIDSPKLNSGSSGLASVVEKFKDFELSGHITLSKGERSQLATYAAKVM